MTEAKTRASKKKPEKIEIDWDRLAGKTLRIPIDDERICLAFVVDSYNFQAIVYAFGSFTDEGIRALNGQLPPFDEALTLMRVFARPMTTGHWTVDESFGVSAIPTKIPALARDPNGPEFGPVWETASNRDEIFFRPKTWQQFDSMGYVRSEGDIEFWDLLALLTTAPGDVIKCSSPYGDVHRSPQEIQGKGWAQKREVRDIAGRVFPIALDKRFTVYAWVVNQTGQRVDVLFYRTDPSELAQRCTGRELHQAAMGRWVYFVDKWLARVIRKLPGEPLDPAFLGEYRTPAFGLTRIEFPKGRYDVRVEFDSQNLWEIASMQRLEQEDMADLYPFTALTEIEVQEQLYRVLRQVPRWSTMTWEHMNARIELLRMEPAFRWNRRDGLTYGRNKDPNWPDIYRKSFNAGEAKRNDRSIARAGKMKPLLDELDALGLLITEGEIPGGKIPNSKKAEAYPILLRAFPQYDDPDVRGWISHYLHFSVPGKFVPDLIDLYRMEKGRGRDDDLSNMARLIVYHGNREYYEDYFEFASDPEYGSNRSPFVENLWRVSPDPRILPLLHDLVDDPDIFVSRGAIYSLRRIGDPSSQSVFERFLNHSDEDIRKFSQLGLEKIAKNAG